MACACACVRAFFVASSSVSCTQPGPDNTQHEVCRPAVAVELACRCVCVHACMGTHLPLPPFPLTPPSTQCPTPKNSVCQHHIYPRAALVAQSMVKEGTYKDVLRRAEQALDLRATYTPRQLSVVLGGEQAVDLAERLLGAYEVCAGGSTEKREARTYRKEGVSSLCAAVEGPCRLICLRLSPQHNGYGSPATATRCTRAGSRRRVEEAEVRSCRCRSSRRWWRPPSSSPPRNSRCVGVYA